MKDQIHEQLSALVDNELEEQEQALLFRQLASDAELSQRLSRYQIISDALQNHLPEKLGSGFHQRVHAALNDEPLVHAPGSVLAAWFKPVAGVALAASVSMVAVLTLQYVRKDSADVAPALASAAARDSYIRADVDDAVQPGGPGKATPNLDVYLANHSEYAVSRGILPYVRLVGHDMNTRQKD
ncbi:MAG: sigma-E factor negative regulatory protein [Gammaproteobacteria bacterium]